MTVMKLRIIFDRRIEETGKRTAGRSFILPLFLRRPALLARACLPRTSARRLLLHSGEREKKPDARGQTPS